jgi:hypothetical protein
MGTGLSFLNYTGASGYRLCNSAHRFCAKFPRIGLLNLALPLRYPHKWVLCVRHLGRLWGWSGTSVSSAIGSTRGGRTRHGPCRLPGGTGGGGAGRDARRAPDGHRPGAFDPNPPQREARYQTSRSAALPPPSAPGGRRRVCDPGAAADHQHPTPGPHCGQVGSRPGQDPLSVAGLRAGSGPGADPVHTHTTQGKPKSQAGFLDPRAALLPAGCRPLFITEAGFRTPWFRQVERRGGDGIGRIRQVTVCSSTPEWLARKSLYPKATCTSR